MKKTHLLLMLALCATLLASCSAGEPDVTQTQPVPSISPTNTPDENTVLPGLDDDIILPDGGRNDSTTREATGVTSMDKARRVIEQLEEELERLSEVEEAHVSIAGHKAAVALTFDDQYKAGIDDRFRKIVRERIDGVIGGIDTVALTTDKTVMDALGALQERLGRGRGMSSLHAELDKILETMSAASRAKAYRGGAAAPNEAYLFRVECNRGKDTFPSDFVRRRAFRLGLQPFPA